MLEHRLVTPMGIEEIPIGVFRFFELRDMGELEQAVDNLERLVANAQGAFGFSRAWSPRYGRPAVGALE